MNYTKRNTRPRIAGTRSPDAIAQRPNIIALGSRRMWIRYSAWPVVKPAKERRA